MSAGVHDNTEWPPMRALLFDLDGTLIDSLTPVARCWAQWAREYGIERERFLASDRQGRPARELVAEFLTSERVPEGLRRIEELEVADVDGIVALPGAGELLRDLPRHRWSVVTSGTRPLAEARMAAAGIMPPELVTASDVRRGKPDPEPYLVAARRLGVAPADCVVFEDAPAGLAAGRAAGMRTVGITGPEQADTLHADVLIPDLGAVKALSGLDGVELWFDARDVR